MIRKLIEQCRRKQDERDRMFGFHEWATEDEALQEWHNRTIPAFTGRVVIVKSA